MLTHIVETCQHAENFINRTMSDYAEVKTYILSPEDDALIDQYSHLPIITGPEDDVLARYMNLVRREKPDYVVRITSDCPHHESHIISRHIKAAIKHKKHYTTNTIWRTEKEGMDTEVISSKLLIYLNEKLKEPFLREHVTNHISESVTSRKFPFRDFNFDICHIMDKYNQSHIKTSVDTEEDYQKTVDCFNEIEYLKKNCKKSGIFVI
jgi:spore coat polysaccharide biosynthesis protein SpsF (cytidylyltransferase family)